MQRTTPDTLLALRLEPEALEAAYRRAPEPFAEALPEALDRAPGDLVLQAWAARLDLAPVAETAQPDRAWRFADVLTPERVRRLLLATAGLILAAGTWAKLPDLLGWTAYASGDVDPSVYERTDRFYMRSVPFLAVLPLLALFALRYRPDRRVLAVVGGAVAALVVVQAVRPTGTDAWTLSLIHTPLLLLSLAGVAALGARWRETDGRIGVLRLMGETAAFAALFLLGGGLLLALTVGLFEAIGVSIDTVLEWVAVYGAVGVLPVAALVVSQRVEALRVAPLVARVFGPMALVVLAVYLPTLVATGGLKDRDSLLALNVALIAVLALVILMQAERPDVRRHWTDGVAFGLVAVALLADLFALGSIAERLLGGMTPNRLAVVGLNALIAVHFAGLVVPLARRAFGQGAWPGDGWTARFLTVYAGWTAFVVLVLPFLF